MPIVRLLEGKGFDDEQVARLGAAFDVAWQVLKTEDPTLNTGPLNLPTREVLAKYIIEEAQTGLRDMAQLAEHAVDRWRSNGKLGGRVIPIR